ncbi:hypothetical protein GCM10010441_29570 [Kitasatospora paracochleata]|uniref:Uncharacterized protein n=1 Tax=Kitasatospora paracochleata TaxID=58354 RepID=A0ABT1JA23_9ACTN|nr:hypothetical protein [Kitasatospora paracochleata]MCP2313918.1 hypothetical protein [Kitasatospora paracochleata]
MSDFETARAFISTATAEQVELIAAALRSRRLALRPAPAEMATRTSSMVQIASPGDRVRIDRIRPQYLKGLTGMVIHARVSRVDIELDAESTLKLAATRQTRFEVPAGATSFVIEGVHPTSYDIL